MSSFSLYSSFYGCRNEVTCVVHRECFILRHSDAQAVLWLKMVKGKLIIVNKGIVSDRQTDRQRERQTDRQTDGSSRHG